MSLVLLSGNPAASYHSTTTCLHRMAVERAFQNDCRYFLTPDSHQRAPPLGFSHRDCFQVPEQGIWYLVLVGRLGCTAVYVLTDDTYTLILKAGLDATNLPLCSRSTSITPVDVPRTLYFTRPSRRGEEVWRHHLESKDSA